MLRRYAPRNDGKSKHESATPRRDAPESLRLSSPQGGRGECRVPRTRSRVCSVESTRVSHHEYAEHPAFPHAMVLTAYVVLSPVTGLFCHRHPLHPAPTSVTIAKRPSVWDGMRKVLDVIWGCENRNIFAKGARHPCQQTARRANHRTAARANSARVPGAAQHISSEKLVRFRPRAANGAEIFCDAAGRRWCDRPLSEWRNDNGRKALRGAALT